MTAIAHPKVKTDCNGVCVECGRRPTDAPPSKRVSTCEKHGVQTQFVPYSKIRPRTNNLHELRAELKRVREVHGRGSSQAFEASAALNAAAHDAGTPLDALRSRSRDEAERFFAHTVPGPDSHVYWMGPKRFRRNDGLDRNPERWWWAHAQKGDLQITEILVSTCGDEKCINPEHRAVEAKNRQRITDEQMIESLQRFALLLGESPMTTDWRDHHMSPSPTLFEKRFGSWGAALTAAGLKPRPIRRERTSAADCIKAVRLARKVCGHWPTADEVTYRSDVRKALTEAGLPRAQTTLTRYLGTWDEALRKAGKR